MNGNAEIVYAALAQHNEALAMRRAEVLLLIRDGVDHIDEIVESCGTATRSASYGDISVLGRLGFLDVPEVAHGEGFRRRPKPNDPEYQSDDRWT